MTTTSAEPALYDVTPDGTPVLRGVRDSAGFVSFPYQDAGSLLTGEHGADAIPVTLSGRGRIQAMATVHRHHGGDADTPFTVASIVLDEGPVVRGVLTDPDAAHRGALVRAVTVPTSGDLRELRFAPISEER